MKVHAWLRFDPWDNPEIDSERLFDDIMIEHLGVGACSLTFVAGDPEATKKLQQSLRLSNLHWNGTHPIGMT